jgi:hypothetical protein
MARSTRQPIGLAVARSWTRRPGPIFVVWNGLHREGI